MLGLAGGKHVGRWRRVEPVADPNKIALEVRIAVCGDCGAYGDGLEACRSQRHHVTMVHYEISAEQNDAVASQRITDLRHHGRRLLGEDMP